MNIDLIHERIQKSMSVKAEIIKNDQLIRSICVAAAHVAASIKGQGKILFAGNGGSFADAQHLCAELICRLSTDRSPMPAVTLGANNSTISAIANDYGFENVFSRELEALFTPGDLFFAISTSGNSKNILKALEVAAKLNCQSILLTGQTIVDLDMRLLSLNVPSQEIMHIQESHIMIRHIICELVEEASLRE